MKAMSKVLILAIFTLTSASVFAAGENKDSGPCQEVATKAGDKAQVSKAAAASDEAPKDTKAKKAE